MLFVETGQTAVFDCICWFSSSRERKGQSYPVEYYLESMEQYSEGKIHKSEPKPGNGNVNTVYFVIQAPSSLNVVCTGTSSIKMAWTLSLKYLSVKSRLLIYEKILILATDRGWKSAREIISKINVSVLKLRRRTHSHNRWLLLVYLFIIWLAPQAGKMNQIARCDWLPEPSCPLGTTRCIQTYPAWKISPKAI